MVFGDIRALVKKDSALLFDGNRPNVQLLAGELAGVFREKMAELRETTTSYEKNQDGDDVRIIYPDDFEIIFIEEVIRHTCDTYYRRLRVYEPIINSVMSKADENLFSMSGVQHLMPLKDSLQEFEMVVDQCLDCLTTLLKNDEVRVGLCANKNNVLLRRYLTLL